MANDDSKSFWWFQFAFNFLFVLSYRPNSFVGLCHPFCAPRNARPFQFPAHISPYQLLVSSIAFCVTNFLRCFVLLLLSLFVCVCMCVCDLLCLNCRHDWCPANATVNYGQITKSRRVVNTFNRRIVGASGCWTVGPLVAGRGLPSQSPAVDMTALNAL